MSKSLLVRVEDEEQVLTSTRTRETPAESCRIAQSERGIRGTAFPQIARRRPSSKTSARILTAVSSGNINFTRVRKGAKSLNRSVPIARDVAPTKTISRELGSDCAPTLSLGNPLPPTPKTSGRDVVAWFFIVAAITIPATVLLQSTFIFFCKYLHPAFALSATAILLMCGLGIIAKASRLFS